MSSWVRFALLLAASATAGAIAAWPDWNQPTRLTFLAVGQGDCIVFQTRGHTVLIDVGPKRKGPAGSAPFDAGQRIVIPDLRRMGIDSVDLILLSHPDMDHIGGLGAILKGMPVGRVLVSSGFEHFQPMVDRLAEAGCGPDKTVWLGPDQSAKVGDFGVEIVCPPWRDPEPDNDGSEFVRIAGDGASAVFTGDGSQAEEAEMMPGRDWSAQVLKLGHHGSSHSSGEPFLEAVHPTWAVVSCGRDNEYGFPKRDVLDRVQALGVKIARTDRDGDVVFELGPHGWERDP
ncbi:MAG TPA: MBL fold metallo-hydrolase [Fimbriimonadaceae bacterium]|nr:MBL fold metallo-hydrolase [Fimbriimonadaceae bacterium]